MKKTSVLLWYWGRHGGGPKYTLELARVLAKCPSIQVHLSLSRQSDFFEQSMALNLPGWHLDTYTNIHSAVLSSLRLPVLKRKFFEYILKNKIQIINCTMSHLWNAFFVPCIHRAGAKFVLTVHDALPHPGEENTLRRWLLKKEINSSDALITLTEHVKLELGAVYKYPQESITVIPHGVFNYGVNCKARKFPHDRPLRLLFFGRILKYKGLDIMVDAYKQIVGSMHRSIELYITGSGESCFSDYRKIPGLFIDNRWIPENEISDIFNKADLVITPYIEASQSGVIPTAYAAGLPVVATPVGGIKEQVWHKHTGIIADSVKSKDVAKAIAELVNNPELYEKCSARALYEAENNLSWALTGKKVLGVLQEIAVRH
jgi:glycosyltransferase involved in cell wall biosynthesis